MNRGNSGVGTSAAVGNISAKQTNISPSTKKGASSINTGPSVGGFGTGGAGLQLKPTVIDPSKPHLF